MPYIVLAMSALLAAAVTWRSGSLATKVAVLLAAGAFIDAADIVAILLDLYAYRPGLLLSPVADARLGVLLADFVFVPVLTAVGLVATRLNRLLVGVLLVWTFAAAEEAFTLAGIFIPIGWKLWYTPVLFGLYAALMAWWAGRFEREGYSPVNRAVVIVSSTQYTWTILGLLLGGVFRLFELRLYLLPSPEKDDILAGVVLYLIPFTLIAGLLVWNRLATRFAWVLAAGLLWAAWAVILKSAGLRHEAPGWGPVGAGMVMIGAVRLLGAMDAWFTHNDKRAGLRL